MLGYLDLGCLLSFIGCVFLVISFGSPYWLASWQDTRFVSPISAMYQRNVSIFARSPFLNLGLWTSCFHLFRHPKVQFDHLYNGCYSVWGDSLKMIAYWMVPGTWTGSPQSCKYQCRLDDLDTSDGHLCSHHFHHGAAGLRLSGAQSPRPGCPQVIAQYLYLHTTDNHFRFERRLVTVLMILNLLSAVFMLVSVTVRSHFPLT